MNILIIDPKDNPLDHKLIEMEWDLIIDLAWSTPDFIELLSSKHSCRVIQIDQYFNNQETLIEMATIKQSLLGKVVDSHGINWSDILAPYISTITKNIMRVYQLNKMIDKNDEIFFTRENLVYKFLKRKKMYILKKSYAQNPVSKFLYSIKSFFIGIRNLDLIQFIWVLANRLDPFFSVRSVIFRKRIINNPQMILAPIPFINVGNLIHKIAKYNHDFNFTFIYEGLFFNQSHIGQNINNSFIYAYIPKRQEITNESYELKKQLVNHALKYLSEKEINREAVLDGLESSFQNLSQGLLLREAIVKIIKKYKPHAVLSGDENNMFGRISIYLGKKFGINTISIHHGILDLNTKINGRSEYLSDTFITKSALEDNYLDNYMDIKNKDNISSCYSRNDSLISTQKRSDDKKFIIYYSEDYEATDTRSIELYRDIIPELIKIAEDHNKQLIVKLHPAESYKHRKKLLRSVVSKKEYKKINIIQQEIDDSIYENIWFSFSIASSVVIEMLNLGIPSVTCIYLDRGHSQYPQYFCNHGAIPIYKKSEISTIPHEISKLSNEFLQQGHEFEKTIKLSKFF